MSETLPVPGRADFLAVIDDVASRFAAPPWEGEIARAREVFDGLRGQVYDDEESYDDHMSAFLDWYTVERALPGGLSPVVADLVDATEQGRAQSELELALRRALGASHRSLFELYELAPESLRLLDLIWGGLWRVARAAPQDGLRLGEIFEGRLIPWAGGVLLGPVCWWHPMQAVPQIRVIVQEAAQRGQCDAALVDRLAHMRLRHTRFRNIAMARIYSLDGIKGKKGGRGPSRSGSTG